MAFVISVVNQKGGVGKTTTVVNLSAALANMGHKTLVIDLDPQGHSTEHLGINKASQANTVLESLNEEKTLLSCVIPTYLPNLWISPSNLRLGQFNQQNPAGRQFALKKALTEENKAKFDFILIDCQPSLSLLTLNALTSSDKVVLPVQAEYLALDGLSQLILTLKEVKNKLHPHLSILGILVTMFDRRNNLSSEVKNELEKNFGKDLLQVQVPRAVRLAEAPSFGKSIFEYDPRSEGAQAYLALAKEILARIGYPPSPKT
jgi:chromosome partitioning protein